MATSPETFEYAIKKDVRNNPIVREVDERRLREQWHFLAIGGLLVVVILFSGWQRVELLQHGYRVEQMQRQPACVVHRPLLQSVSPRAQRFSRRLAYAGLGVGKNAIAATALRRRCQP